MDSETSVINNTLNWAINELLKIVDKYPVSQKSAQFLMDPEISQRTMEIIKTFYREFSANQCKISPKIIASLELPHLQIDLEFCNARSGIKLGDGWLNYWPCCQKGFVAYGVGNLD